MTTEFEVTSAPEEGVIGIQVDFTDEAGVDLTPTSITWTLTNRPAHGVVATVINGREDEVFTPASNSITITLSGDDLAFLADESGAFVERVLTVKFVYDSDLGDDLPGRAQCVFFVEDVYAV